MCVCVHSCSLCVLLIDVSTWMFVGAGGETGGDLKHMCHQGVATFANDRLTGPRQPPAGAVLLRYDTKGQFSGLSSPLKSDW